MQRKLKRQKRNEWGASERDGILLSAIFFYKVSPTLGEFWNFAIYVYTFLDNNRNYIYTPKDKKKSIFQEMHYLSMSFLHTLFFPSFMSSICPPVPITSHSRWGWGWGRGHKIYYQSAFFCVCACGCPAASLTPYGPLHLISPICFQDRYCLHRGEKALPPFVSLSLSVCLSPVWFTHRRLAQMCH